MNQLRQKLIEFFNKTSGYHPTPFIAARISGVAPERVIPTRKVLSELKRMEIDKLIERNPVKHSSYHYWRVKGE